MVLPRFIRFRHRRKSPQSTAMSARGTQTERIVVVELPVPLLVTPLSVSSTSAGTGVEAAGDVGDEAGGDTGEVN